MSSEDQPLLILEETGKILRCFTEMKGTCINDFAIETFFVGVRTMLYSVQNVRNVNF
jgi:hypothetical protein